MTGVPSCTIAIPSFQRCDSLRRLLECLLDEASSSRPEGLTVLVVLDGSTDGSRAMLADMQPRAAELGAPIRVIWQPNQGLAAARQRALDAATGELVLFLDDDMVPSPGLTRRHRDGHAGVPAHVVMGPCHFPASADIVFMNREWAEYVYSTLEDLGRVESAEFFSAANTSAPRDLWQSVGGFDRRFRGWGAEDHDIGARFLRDGVTIEYDKAAIAWHHQSRGIRSVCRTKEDEGRNLVRLAEAQPRLAAELFPEGEPNRAVRRVRSMLGLRRSSTYRRAARSLAVLAELEAWVSRGRSREIFYTAVACSLISGVADHDHGDQYVKRSLGLEVAARGDQR